MKVEVSFQIGAEALSKAIISINSIRGISWFTPAEKEAISALLDALDTAHRFEVEPGDEDEDKEIFDEAEDAPDVTTRMMW